MQPKILSKCINLMSSERQRYTYISGTGNMVEYDINEPQGIWMIFFKNNNVYFGTMVSQIYPSDFQLNKANTSDTEPCFKTCICQFLMILFLPKFMINVTT